MDKNEKLLLISSLESSAEEFAESVKPYLNNPEILDGRPEKDMWTVREHIVHVAESEIAAFHRYRKAIAEPGMPVLGYNEEVWTPCPELGYKEEDPAPWIDFLLMMRKLEVSHLRRIADLSWDAYAYEHSSFGTVSLERWVADYIEHIAVHREYMERNIRLL
ncbi:MAG: DinB family protein [Spirochaetales bacterium]|nr:DinB family protein [Spirochaetales bacterium]